MNTLPALPIATIVGAFVFICFCVFWLGIFINLYHLIRFGIGTQPKKISIIFFTGSMIVFGLTVIMFATLDFDALKQVSGKAFSGISTGGVTGSSDTTVGHVPGY